jgi:G3E family GTPase
MKMIILGGFLGAGKTSLVLQMAKYLVGEGTDHPAKVVILENEIGEVSIDDKVLKNGGFEVSTMFSGCVCCTTAGELVSNVYRVQETFHPDWVIVEATGVAYPRKIKENIEHSIRLDSCRIFCVADAKRWIRIRKVMEAFMRDQLDGADVIFVNKIDMVDEETLTQVKESIREFNEAGRCIPVSAIQPIEETVWQQAFEE